jgi:hypothetical protein
MIVRNRPFGLNTTFMRLCAIRQRALFRDGSRADLRHARPAAIRRLGVTGKMPVLPEKDGRHPKYENHGRIAGR